MQPNSLKHWPKISIVTPSFNQGKFIERTIKSVLDQNYPNLEYWVIDGGSTDETLSILKKYDDKINWVSEPDKGQTDAINKGLKRSTGEILAYLNSDDIYETHVLHAVAEYFQNHPDASIVCGKGKLIDENDKYIGDYHNAPLDLTKPQPTCSICQPAVFWKQEVVQSSGYFDDSFHLAMDYEYWMRISKKHVFEYVNDYLAASRIHSSTKTSNDQRGMTNDVIRAQKTHYNLVHERWLLNQAYLSEGNYFQKFTTLFKSSLRCNHRFPTIQALKLLLSSYK